jgi:hypothetical protein
MRAMKLITAFHGSLTDARYQLWLKALPFDQPPEVDRLVLLLDGIGKGDARGLVKGLRPRWDLETVTGIRNTPRWYPPALKKYVAEDLGFKIVLPLYHNPPWLWLDSDIVVTRDMRRHLQCGTAWTTTQGVDRWYERKLKDGSKVPSALASEIHDRFGFLCTKYSAADAAMYFLPRYDMGDVEDWLRWWAVLEGIEKESQRSYQGLHTLDQKFLALWLGAQGAHFVNGGTVKLPDAGTSQKMDPHDVLYHAYGSGMNWYAQHAHDERFPNATFWHYPCAGVKEEAVAKYTAWLDPAGEGFRPERFTPHRAA